MECAIDDVPCMVAKLWNWVASEDGKKQIWQYVKDFAAIAGVVLAALKWWEGREAYVFGQLNSLLGEQGTRTRAALGFVIRRMQRPGPADRPPMPLFAERPLRRLFRRRHWKPVLSLAGPLTSAERKLRRLHNRLDKRQDSASKYQSFVNEQRFAAHMLQGAIASGRSERVSNENRLSRLNEMALESFQRALAVPGKENDLNALEAYGLLLRKLGQTDPNILGGAPQTFRRLQAVADNQLSSVDPGAIDQRRILTSTIGSPLFHVGSLRSSLPAIR